MQRIVCTRTPAWGGNYVRLLEIERKEVLGEWVDPDRVAKLNEEIDAYYRANYPQAKGGC